jgi:hypothetical protein
VEGTFPHSRTPCFTTAYIAQIACYNAWSTSNAPFRLPRCVQTVLRKGFRSPETSLFIYPLWAQIQHEENNGSYQRTCGRKAVGSKPALEAKRVCIGRRPMSNVSFPSCDLRSHIKLTSCRGVFSLRHNLSNDIERVHLFRSYDSPSRPHTLNTRQAAAAEPTWAIARATSAAPTYFAPMRINNDHYFDAGTSGLNNPSVDALLEVMYMPTNMTKSSLEEGSKAHSESPARTAIATQPQVSLLISIGTGERNKPSRFSRSTSFSILSIIRLLKYALSSMTATEDQHLHAKHICLISGIKYYRFNVAEGLEHISLDDNRHINFLDRMRGNKTKRTLEEIEEVTARYLKRPVVEQQLWKAAKDLIAARRTRVPPPIEPLPDLRTSMSSTENTLLGNSRVRTK